MEVQQINISITVNSYIIIRHFNISVDYTKWEIHFSTFQFTIDGQNDIKTGLFLSQIIQYEFNVAVCCVLIIETGFIRRVQGCLCS